MSETAEPEGTSMARRIRGHGFGSIPLAVFGGGWLIWGLAATGVATPLALAAIGVASLVIVALGVRLGRSAARVQSPARTRVARGFLWVNLAQWAAIGIAWFALARVERLQALPIAVSIIVALHFLPLAVIFARKAILYTAAALLALDAAALWIGGDRGAIIAALGTGAILWATAATRLAIGYGLRAMPAAPPDGPRAEAAR